MSWQQKVFLSMYAMWLRLACAFIWLVTANCTPQELGNLFIVDTARGSLNTTHHAVVYISSKEVMFLLIILSRLLAKTNAAVLGPATDSPK